MTTAPEVFTDAKWIAQEARRQALEEAAALVDDHYWDSTGAAGKAHGDSLAKMIRALIHRQPQEKA